MSVKSLLEAEIESEFEALGRISDIGTDSYKTTVDGLTKLVDRYIEVEKIENDVKEKSKNREQDKEFKQKQFDLDKELRREQFEFDKKTKIEQSENNKKDQKIKNVLTGVGIVLPVVVTVWGTIKSLRFEQEGTVTTIMGRGFIGKLLPKK